MPTGQSGGLSRARFHDGDGDGNGNALVTSRDCGRNARQGFRGSGSHNRGEFHGNRVLHVRNDLRSSRFLYVPVRGVLHIRTCFFLLFP
jgi:hypothetical protein